MDNNFVILIFLGTPTFQPNGWGFPQAPVIFTENATSELSEEKPHQPVCYDDTARSFSAAAAVAAVAAAAYISSSNAVATSGYFHDTKRIKYGSPICEKPVMREGSR